MTRKPYKLNDKHYDAVRRLTNEKRFDYFVKRAGDWRDVYVLGNEAGLKSAADETGKEYIPVWPHPRFAEDMAQGEWSDGTPERMSLREFLADFLPWLDDSGRGVVVFPIADCNAPVIDPLVLKQTIKAYVKENYG